jgi:hypothetical protein
MVGTYTSPRPKRGPTLSPTALPGVLPGNLLIADRANNRVIEVTPDRKLVWEFPGPGDLQPGQHFRWPDDAFYAPDGKSIVVNATAKRQLKAPRQAPTGIRTVDRSRHDERDIGPVRASLDE